MGRHSTAAGPTPVPATTAARPSAERPVTDVPASATSSRGGHTGFWVSTAVFWLLGLVAGFIAALAVVGRVGCTAGSTGLACTNAGSALGALLLLAVIVTVGTVTVFAAEVRDRPRQWLSRYGIGLVPMLLVVIAARLLATTL